MSSVEPSSVTDPALAAEGLQAHGTMPPPELLERVAPASVGSLVLATLRAETPAQRHHGPPATEASLRVELGRAIAAGDITSERHVGITLARLLASRGREIDRAIDLALRSLALPSDVDDPADTAALRVELAGWQSALGDAAGAAATLRALLKEQTAPETLRTLLKIALLFAHAGDAGRAAETLDEAAAASPGEGIAVELFARLAAWAPDTVAIDGAAHAYLEASRRRAAAEDHEAAYEDILRAFDLAPQEELAANAVAAALTARGARGGADEAMRQHAISLGEPPSHSPTRVPQTPPEDVSERALAVHRRRLIAALKDGDGIAAVAAALDGSLEGVTAGDDALRVDEALSVAGLYELLAVRLEARAEQQRGQARSEAYRELAKLYAGSLARPDRALEAWTSAFAADPSASAVLTAIREQTSADPLPLAEALIRAGLNESVPAGPRRGALRELAELASGRLQSPVLRAWAVSTGAALGDEGRGEPLASSDGKDERAHEDDDLEAALRALASASASESASESASSLHTQERERALRLVVAAYRARPRDRQAYVRAAAELARAVPGDREALTELERAVARLGDSSALEEILRARSIEGSTDPQAPLDVAQAHLALAGLARQRGDDLAALAASRAAFRVLAEAADAADARAPNPKSGGPSSRAAAASALFFATRTSRSRERADALVDVASSTGSGLRATLLAIAAQLYADAGQARAAHRAASEACEADPTNARAVVARAFVFRANRELDASSLADRAAASAIEQAMTTVLPRSAACAQIAQAYDRLGDPTLALAWTERCLALQPGRVDAMRDLLTRAVATGAADRVSSALTWVLAQPRPLGELEDAILAALDRLASEDPDGAAATRAMRPRARALARRVLDVLGPRSDVVRAKLLELADRVLDPGLAIAVLERQLAIVQTKRQDVTSGADGATIAGLLLDLVGRRAAAGDPEGAAIELAQAAREGADPGRILERVEQLAPKDIEAVAPVAFALTSDARAALAEARAVALDRLGEERARDAAVAYRELGGLLWDLAGDPGRAEAAFYRACELSPAGGVERYGQDLWAFGGVVTAIDTLTSRATSNAKGSNAHRASLLIEAGNLATEHGLSDRALLAAVEAIALDPSRSDAVALVERNAHAEGGIDHLDRTYDRLANAALGCFGRRAAHYRGARQLERRGALVPALRHAALCFEAVPSEGTSYVLLSRLAERVGDPREAVRALERVADVVDVRQRPHWFKRAAQLAANGPEGPLASFDLLIRALNARPDPETVADVANLVRTLTLEGDGAGLDDTLRLRSERAVMVALKRLDGPDGARAAVAMANLAVDLHAPELAFAALDKAMTADGDIDEFASLDASIPVLAEGGAMAKAWVAGVRATADKPYSSVGKALLTLASHVAASVRDEASRAALLVLAVQRVRTANGGSVGVEDDPLVEEADEATRSLGDPTLRAKLDALVEPSARALAAVRLAEKSEREGLEEDAIAFLDRALGSGMLTADARARASLRLKNLLGRAGRLSDAEGVLRSELARKSITPPAKGRVVHDLVDLLIKRDRKDEAFDVLAGFATRGETTDPELLAEMRGLARATDRLDRYAEVLVGVQGALPATARGDAQRLEILRELAPLLEEIGDAEGAAACYEDIGRLDPKDLAALEVVESHATARGEYALVAELLGRRIEHTPPGDKRRMLRLRRAAVLEQHQGALDEACAELKTLLEEAPDDPSALRFLADVHEHRKAPLEAAELLMRLEALAETAEDKSAYALRAGAAYLAGGELDRAAHAVDRAAAAATDGGLSSLVELKVEIARARGDGGAVAEALEELAASSSESDERRASFLLEAARAALQAGDDVAALARTRRALDLAPNMPEAVIEAARIRYRTGGPGTPREAQAAVDELTRIEDRLPVAWIGLHAFLLAEELDVIQGGGAGMRELSRRHAEHGPLPLVALGMAERLVRGKNFEAALPLFEHALKGKGDLEGMRQRGRVALAAAEAAVIAQAFTSAAELLDLAASEPDTQALAERRQLELAATIGDPPVAREALETLLQTATGVDRARFLVQLAKIVAASDVAAAVQLLDEAAALAPLDRSIGPQVAAARAALPNLDLVYRPGQVAAATSAGNAEALVALEALSSVVEHQAPQMPVESRPRSRSGRVATIQADAERALPARHVEDDAPAAKEPQVSSGEAALMAALAAGSFEAGEELVAAYGGPRSSRTHEILAVRRQQAQLRLGDTAVLQRLSEAAMLDGNAAYARAVEHVVHAWEAKATPTLLLPTAPALAAQRLAPELVSGLVFRGIAESPVHEALALVLETGLYRRDVGQYQLTGVARVQASGGTLLGEVFGVVARYLGQPRTPLFHRRGPASPMGTSETGPRSMRGDALEGPVSSALSMADAPLSILSPLAAPTYKVALLSPPAIVLTGEVREDSAELRYLVGEALAGAMPEHALVNALAEDGLRTLIEALHAAFGPVAALPRGNAAVARLGQNLWQLVPPRADRRLRELCSKLDRISLDAAVKGTRQAMRRAGLFASGNLSTALARITDELASVDGASLPAPDERDGLARACSSVPAIADLVRLATAGEFAEARWALPQMPRTDSGARGARS